LGIDIEIKRNNMKLCLFKIKEAMVWNEKEHKEKLARNESKFFEEKMRLQQESNKKIEELAQRAHDEAIKFVLI
jgi:ABC-type Zn uptake system ZnuABC Zn-binding protein ZnuA